MQLHRHEVLRRPLVTEKGVAGKEEHKYFFEVHSRANKVQIKEAVEQIFKVHVVAVQTMNCRGKTKTVRFRRGRRSDWKKAVVTLREGDAIEIV